MADRTGTELRGLDPRFAPTAAALINAAREAGYPLVVQALGGRRSTTQQRRLVGARLSQTMQSRHLHGLAFDVDILGMNRDAVPLWFWQMLGPWAEQVLGLRWGGRWASRDYGHFEAR